jgi:hypothetical protein
MKKFLVVSLMLVLLGGLVTAQELGVSAEVTGKYDIVNYTGYDGDGDVPKGFRDTLAGTVPVDGTLKFAAQDEAAGLELVIDLSDLYALDAKGWNWGNDNKAAVWFKPLKNDLLTFKAGAKPGDGTLQYGDLNGLPEKFMADSYRVIVEDYISGFGGDPYGLIITTAPVQNLFIGLGWKTSLKNGDADSTAIVDRAPRLGDNYLGIQIGAGYTIENIGSARLQLVAPYAFEYDKTKDDSGYNSLLDVYGTGTISSKFNAIQAGFKVDALKSMGLDLDVVASIPLSTTKKDKTGGSTVVTTYGAPIKFAVVAAFATGNISVNGGIGLALPYTSSKTDASGDKPKENDAIELKFNVAPALKIGDSVTVGADIAFVLDPGQASGFKQDGTYQLHEKNGKGKLGTPMDLGFDLFVKYTVGKGTLKTGIGVTVPNLGGLDLEPDNDDAYHNPVNFRIPLTFTVGF